MSDYFEIDFINTDSDKSADAIALRYEINGRTYIHVVDGGFQDDGQKVVNHIKEYYGDPSSIDHVVVTHPDGDHVGGLRTVLESFDIGTLWMLRPWDYASEILGKFSHFTTVDGLMRRLREIYAPIAELEDIAIKRGIPIREPFQGNQIGAFTVLAPSRLRYLDLVVSSEKTPESVQSARNFSIGTLLSNVTSRAVNLVKGIWGSEIFPEEGTSDENEMSVIQYANLCSEKILLTGDAGREALNEAAIYARAIGISLPGINRFQVPHHGSRHNVSSELLDIWLGPKLSGKNNKFSAIISASGGDPDHPRKAVIRACIHRGGIVHTNEGGIISAHAGALPNNRGWGPAAPSDYPDEQEALD